MRLRSLGLAAGGLLTLAIGGLMFIKPLRIAAPSIFGMHCDQNVCAERVEDLAPATQLVGSLRHQIEEQTGQTVPDYKVVLCRTPACYRRFGGGGKRAMSYPWLGMIVAGPDWQDYIIRHELVHWVQFATYGALATMQMPEWQREGMAYALSGAPDADIPEHYQPLIATYKAWQSARRDHQIWNARDQK